MIQLAPVILLAILAWIVAPVLVQHHRTEFQRTHRCAEPRQPRWPGEAPCRAWVRIAGERKGR